MKSISTLIMSFFLCVCFSSNAQNSSHTSLVFKNHSFLSNDNIGYTASTSQSVKPNLSQLGYDRLMNLAGEDPLYQSKTRRYNEALHKRNVGIGLTAAGGATLVAGVAMLAVGASNVNNNANNGNDAGFIANVVEIAFGTIFTLAGTSLTIPGGIILGRGLRDLDKAKAAAAN